MPSKTPIEILTDDEIKQRAVDKISEQNTNDDKEIKDMIGRLENRRIRDEAYNNFLQSVALLRSNYSKKIEGASKFIEALIMQSELIVENIMSLYDTNPDRITELTSIICWANKALKGEGELDDSILQIINKEMSNESFLDNETNRVISRVVLFVLFFLLMAAPLMAVPFMATLPPLVFGLLIVITPLLASFSYVGGLSIGDMKPKRAGREVRELNSFFKASETQGDEKVAEHQGEDISTPAVSVDLAPAM